MLLLLLHLPLPPLLLQPRPHIDWQHCCRSHQPVLLPLLPPLLPVPGLGEARHVPDVQRGGEGPQVAQDFWVALLQRLRQALRHTPTISHHSWHKSV